MPTTISQSSTTTYEDDFDNPPLQRTDTTTPVTDIYECVNCETHFIMTVPLDENRCNSCGVITYDAKLVS